MITAADLGTAAFQLRPVPSPKPPPAPTGTPAFTVAATAAPPPNPPKPPPPMASSSSAPLGSGGSGGLPTPTGDTVTGQYVWQNPGTVTAVVTDGAANPQPTTQDQAKQLIAQAEGRWGGILTFVFGNYAPGDTRSPRQDPESFDQLLKDKGATDDELAFVHKMQNGALHTISDSAPKGPPHNAIDDKLTWIVDEHNIGAFYLNDYLLAWQLHTQNMTPLQWYAQSWFDDARAASKANKIGPGASTAQKPPTVVAPPKPASPTTTTAATTSKTLALVALAAGLAYVLLGCTGDPKMHIENVVVRFPFVNGQNGAIATDASPLEGQYVTIGPGSFVTTFGTWVATAQSINIPRPTEDALMGISIAPDSPIAQCDVLTTGGGGGANLQSVHRISVGNPLMGMADGAQKLLVNLPINLPLLSAGQATGAVVWDGLITQNAAFALSPQWTYPLKLQFWYGVRPTSPSRRAPIHARALMQNTVAGTLSLYVITDGRRRTVVEAYTLGNNRTLTVSEIAKTNEASPDPSQDIALPAISIATSALAAGTPKRFEIGDVASVATASFPHCEVPMMRIDIVDTVGSVNDTWVDVWTYD